MANDFVIALRKYCTFRVALSKSRRGISVYFRRRSSGWCGKNRNARRIRIVFALNDRRTSGGAYYYWPTRLPRSLVYWGGADRYANANVAMILLRPASVIKWSGSATDANTHPRLHYARRPRTRKFREIPEQLAPQRISAE